jgi:hypothetical protein
MAKQSGLHAEFDVSKWKELLGDAECEDLETVFSDSPISIVAIEDVRASLLPLLTRNAAVPVDRFVLAKGEPEARFLTKFNGPPYRPAGLEWPHDRTGRPLTFLGQLCFADSADHIGRLPGEVLLIFVRTMRTLIDEVVPFVDPYDDENCLVFEWHPINIGRLIEPDKVAPPPFVFPTAHGVRFRTVDYSGGGENIQSFAESHFGDRLPRHPFRRQAIVRAVLRQPSFKIGGLPFSYAEPEGAIEDRFLGAIGDISLSSGVRFPWANDSRPLSLNESTDPENFLLFRDGCCINLYLRGDGSVRWTAEFI